MLYTESVTLRFGFEDRMTVCTFLGQHDLLLHFLKLGKFLELIK